MYVKVWSLTFMVPGGVILEGLGHLKVFVYRFVWQVYV